MYTPESSEENNTVRSTESVHYKQTGCLFHKRGERCPYLEAADPAPGKSSSDVLSAPPECECDKYGYCELCQVQDEDAKRMAGY